MVGDDARQPGLDAFEKVRIRNKGDALLPGAVARREVLHVVALREAGLDPFQQLVAQEFGILEGAPRELGLFEQILAADDLVDPLLVHTQHAQFVGQDVLVAGRNEIGRRALQQRHVFALAGDGRHHGRGRRP